MEKKHALAALAALAQETRLDIFRLLVRRGPAGLPVGAIREEFGLAPATLSFHLKELKQARLVRQSREGRVLVHAADFVAMNALLAFLTENCCQGDASSCGPMICAPFSPSKANA
jgi:DNA-binding transcriptional ArsR family regulator